MRVFNLTEKALTFRGRTIPANGGFLEYPELDAFVPDNDKKLEKSGTISFTALPTFWKPKTLHKVDINKLLKSGLVREPTEAEMAPAVKILSEGIAKDVDDRILQELHQDLGVKIDVKQSQKRK